MGNNSVLGKVELSNECTVIINISNTYNTIITLYNSSQMNLKYIYF